MNKPAAEESKGGGFLSIIMWPFVALFRYIDKHFLTYLFGRARRDDRRIYSVKFIWYGDAVYLHPMIWGSLILASLHVAPWANDGWKGWLLTAWLVGLFVCFMTIMYNFDVIKTAIMAVGIVAFMGLAYMAWMELKYNPLAAFARHLLYLTPRVSAGFYVVTAYVFAAMMVAEVVWAWLFHRVEIDESYVYEHRFLRGTEREPIFARGLKRETKDLLELLILGAGDISHRTRKGFKRFKNVPFASLWVGTSLDNMLDYRRRGEIEMTRRSSRDDSDQARVEDAFPEEHEDYDAGDEADNDDFGDDVEDGDDGDDGDGIS